MQKVIYQKRDICVTTNLFKTSRRSYRISDIEKIALKRPLLWFSIPIALGCLGMLNGFNPYLLAHERWICIAGMLFLPLLGWDFGTLTVTSKAYTNDIAAIGSMSTLADARNALDKVMFRVNDKADVVSHEE